MVEKGSGPQKKAKFHLRPSMAVLKNTFVGLAQMLDAGIPFVESLKTLAQRGHQRIRPPLLKVAERIENGAEFSEALSELPRVFEPVWVAAIAAAEKRGDIGDGCRTIAESIKRRVDLRRAIWRKAAYPLLIIVVAALVLPLGRLVAGDTRGYVVGLTTTMAAIFLVLFSFFYLPRLAPGSLLERSARRFLWSVRGVFRTYSAHVRARFCRCLAQNLEAGIELYESIRTAASVTGDPSAISSAQQVIDVIDQGSELSDPLVDCGLLQPADLVILVSGEQAGKLTSSLLSLAATYEERVTRGVQIIISVVAAILMTVAVIRAATGIIDVFSSTIGEIEINSFE